jgi:hypothetical protein
MPAENRGPFPLEKARDLLGIARALYRYELALPPPRASRLRKEELITIGKHFREAFELGTRCERGTMGRKAAWGWLQKACKELEEFVAKDALLYEFVHATVREIEF